MSAHPLPPELNLRLSVDEVNFIVNALAKLPFDQVFTLIRDIEQQCVAQAAANDNKAKPGGTGA